MNATVTTQEQEDIEYPNVQYQPLPEEANGLLEQLQSQLPDAMALDYGSGKIKKPIHIVNPVVFIELKNDDGTYDNDWITDANLAKADQLFNSGTNSLRNYIKKISYGMVDVETVFYPKDINGKVTSVKSPFYKSYLEPATKDTSANTQIDVKLGYDPTMGDVLGSGNQMNSFRTHEYMVYNFALKDVTVNGGGGVAAQIAADFQGDDYLNINSMYTAFNSFSMWEDEFTWIGNAPGQDNPTWPEFFKNWEMLSTDTFTFVLNADDSQSKRMENGKEITHEIYWPHQYAWSMSGGTLQLTEEVIIPSVNVSEGGFKLPLTYVNNAMTLTADTGSGVFADDPDMGVVAHEFLHTLGAPELYRLSYRGQAVGKWDIMGQQLKVPQYPLQFVNQKYGIWETPDSWVINSKMPRETMRTNVEIFAPTYTESDSKTSFKIYPEDYFGDHSKHEYFMVEYRNQAESGFNSSVPGEGLLVYRIRDNVSNLFNGAICGLACGNAITQPNANPPQYDEVFVYRPNVTDPTLLNQVSIDANLDQAVLPRVENGKTIDRIGTIPNGTGVFDPDSLYYSDGTNSGVRIVDIKKDTEKDSMKFTVLYGTEEEIQPFSMQLEDISNKENKVYARMNGVTAQPVIDLKNSESTSFTLSITEVKKDGADVTSQGLFTFTQNAGQKKATLNVATGKTLAVGVYTISLHGVDENNQEADLNLIYEVLPAVPTQDDVDDKLVLENLTLSSHHNVGDVIGNILFEGNSMKDFEIKYHVSSIFEYEIDESKDYAKYFQLGFDDTADNAVIKVKEKIPAGSYELILTMEFTDDLKENDAGTKLTKVVTLVVDDQSEPDEPPKPSEAKPIISTPSGTILSTTTWMNGAQTVAVTISDDTALKNMSVATEHGAFYVNGTETTRFTKGYEVNDHIKSDTVNIPVYRNGTYTITVENSSGGKETATFQITKLDNEIPVLSIAFQNNTAIVQVSDGTPELSGIKQDSLKYTFVNDGDPTTDLTYDQSYTQPVAIPSDFSGSLCAQVYDQAGNHKELCSNISNASDISAPVLNLSDITYTPNGWTNQPVVMSFPIQDDISGIARVSVSTTDGKLLVNNQKVTSHEATYDPGILTENCSFTLAQNGTYVIAYMDHNANASQKTITMKYIDLLPPAFDEDGFVITKKHSDDTAELQLSAHDLPETLDEQSGVKQLYYQYVAQGGQIDQTRWNQYPDADSAAWPNASTDKGSFCAYAIDEAGNESTPQCRKLNASDTTNPVIGEIQGLVDIDKDASGWTNQVPITMSVTVSDKSLDGQSSGSGLKSASIYHNNTLLQPTSNYTGQASDTITFSVSENGSYRIEVEDQEGNISTTPFVVNQIDTTPPVIDKLEVTQQKVLWLFPTEDVNVTVVAHDLPANHNSGIAKYKYYVGTLEDEEDDSTWNTINEDEHISVKKEDVGTLYVYAYDQAGNRSSLYKEELTRDTENQAPSLKALRADHATLSPAFAPDTYTYQASVEHSVSTITFSAESQYDGHTIDGDAGKALTLQDGENVFTITVSNGKNTQTYTIRITRAAETKSESSADLKSLVPSTGTLNPSFTANVLTYTMSVPYDVEQLKFTAQAVSDTAVITGDVAQMISLKNGSNKAVIHVQDGKTSTGYEKAKDYEITIVRMSQTQAQDATLKNLTISSGTLTPTFKASVTAYRAEVDANVDSVKITAHANSSKAVISGDGNKTVSLKTGENTIQVIVQAEDGTKTTYTIVITRKPQVNDGAGKDPVDGTTKEPSSSSTTLKDDQTGISIIGAFDDSFAIVSEVQAATALDEQWAQTYELKEVFDIYITKNGQRYTINDSVTVRIPRKSEWDELDGLGVVYIADDGKIIGMPTTITEEYLEFTTNHFSTYAVVAKKANAVTKGVATGDTTTMMLWGTILTGAFFACVIGIRRHRQLYDYS